MASQKEKAAWTKVLQLLGELSYLYDKQNKLYNNHEKRQEGFNLLLEIYNEMTGENRELRQFKKKIDNMRTKYIKELRKVIASKRTGAGPEDIYEPTVWYFPLFDFLKPEDVAEPSHAEVYIFDERPELLEFHEDSPQQLPKREYVDEDDSMSPKSTTPTLKKQRLTFQTKSEELLNASRTPNTQREGDWEVIGKSIGLQIRDMDEQQHVIIQKIISDTIFYGKMGKLTEDSHITLQSEDSL